MVVAEEVHESRGEPERRAAERDAGAGVPRPFVERGHGIGVGERYGQRADRHDGVHARPADDEYVVGVIRLRNLLECHKRP